MCEMCKPVANKNKSFSKKGTHADTQSQRQNKQKWNQHCMSQKRKSTITNLEWNTPTCLHTLTHTCSRSGAESRSGACCCLRRGTGSRAAWEQGQWRGGQMQWAWPTHSWGGGGCFNSWNTQGLAALTSFNLICIRAIFGGKHRFSLQGDTQGHGKQQQTVDLSLLLLQWIHGGRKSTVFPHLGHTRIYTHTHTQANILFSSNCVYIIKSDLSHWNAS